MGFLLIDTLKLIVVMDVLLTVSKTVELYTLHEYINKAVYKKILYK
jgi:hypothetical protein